MVVYTDEQMKQVLALHGPTVWKLALAHLRNSADAEDIYQEVFLKFLRYQPEFRSGEHQKAWFIRVTANCCKDLLKKAYRRDVPLDPRDAAEGFPEENEVLRLALNGLSPLRRSIIHLHYYEGYTAKEIASLLEMNHSTVRSHLRRACAELKKIMEGETF